MATNNAEDFDNYKIFMLDKLSTHGTEISNIKKEVESFRMETKLAIQDIKNKLASIMTIGTVALNAAWQLIEHFTGMK